MENEISETDRLYDLVTELLGGGMASWEITTTTEDAISDWRMSRKRKAHPQTPAKHSVAPEAAQS
jgi:hypothetical protein